MRRIVILGLSLTLMSLSLSACIYRPDVQQGNVITSADLKGLHIGMTKDEVRSLFGDPVLVDIYESGKMVYVYTFKRRYHEMQETRLIVYLRNDRVSNFWTDHFSGQQMLALPKP